MRDDSSIDPAGTQQSQAPYASGLTQPQTSQPPQAGTGPVGAQPERGGTGVPTTPTTAGQPQAQQSTTPEQGIAREQGIGQDQGIWNTAKADEFRHRWHDVQTHFVEDPSASVTEARQLVDEAVRSLADSVHEREEQLAHAGARSSDSTEGMRDTLLQYHQLLDRLLTDRKSVV